MSTYSPLSQRSSREAPRVGDYRRGSRLRTTPAGTWFPAIGPDDEPAGLLLLHPAVKLSGLETTVKRLIALQVPGILPMKPDLIRQAGRNWLVTMAAPNPSLADVLDSESRVGPTHAAALLSNLAGTLQAVHQAGVAHGLVIPSSVVIGRDGGALLTDWGTSETATRTDDVTGWAETARLLAESWCADDVVAAAVLARAVNAASTGGLVAGRDQLRELAARARREVLTQIASTPPALSRRRQKPGRRAEPTQEPSSPKPPPISGSVPLAAPSPPPPPSQAPPSQAPPAQAPPSQAPPPATPPPPPSAPQPPLSPARPPHEPEPATEKQRRPTSRWQVALAGVTLIALIVAAVDLFLLLEEGRQDDRSSAPAGAPGTAPLVITSVVLEAQRTGSVCGLIGTVTTNGQPGTLIYRWTGGSLNQPVMSMSVPGTERQVQIGVLWGTGNSPVKDTVVTLQVLQPQTEAASTMLEPTCR